MGPNGSGKSTLANAIMGHPGLEVTEGQIIWDGEDITEADTDERSRMGLFMAFQYPVSVPGVTVTKYLRTVMNAHRDARGEEPISLKDFRQTVEAAMELVKVPEEFSRRYLNEGFSGGEKKRMEILQLALQHPNAGDPRRDRLGPRHRRAARRRRRRQLGRRRRDLGRADHHPLPADPAPACSPATSTSCTRAGSSREGGPDLVDELEAKGYGWITDELAGAGRRRDRRPPMPTVEACATSRPSSRSCAGSSTAGRSPTWTPPPPRRRRSRSSTR